MNTNVGPIPYLLLKRLKIDDWNQMIDVNIAMSQPKDVKEICFGQRARNFRLGSCRRRVHQ